MSHAFHTSIVAPASGRSSIALRRLELKAPTKPVVANVTGDFYPAGADRRDHAGRSLGRQIASPVQFVKGLQHALRRRSPGLRRGRTQEGPARLRRGRPGLRARRRRRALHQPPEGRGRRGLQPGPVRPVRSRRRPRPLDRRPAPRGRGRQPCQQHRERQREPEREHELRGAYTAVAGRCRRRHDPRARAALRRRAREGHAPVRRHRRARPLADRASGSEPPARAGPAGRPPGPRAGRRHRRRPRPARHRADLRRRQRRPHPVRAATSSAC